jgi:predicted ATPase
VSELPEHKPELGGMLKSVRIRNFKCYRDSGEIPLAPLTVIIGCNNAGKSSILQPLLLLKQTLMDSSWNTRLVTTGSLVDVGGFQHLPHGRGGARSGDVEFSMSREPGERYAVATDGVDVREATNVKVSFRYNEEASRIEVSKLAYSDSQGEIASFSETANSVEWNAFGINSRQKRVIIPRFRAFLIDCHLKMSASASAKKSEREMINAYVALDMLTHSWLHIFAEIYHIGPVRSRVPWYSGASTRYPSGAPASGENLLRMLAEHSSSKDTNDLRTEMNRWLAERRSAVQNLNLIALDSARSVRSLIADDPAGHKQINVAGMGEGISQMLPILAQVLRVRKWDTFVIEQPEIHLHPAAQADLGDLFVQAVKDGTKQLLVETHSEHLLLRLRRRVAEGVINPDHVSVLFVEKDEKSRQAKVRRLELSRNGHFEEWPDGFFDEGYREALALAVASQHAHNGKRN